MQTLMVASNDSLISSVVSSGVHNANHTQSRRQGKRMELAWWMDKHFEVRGARGCLAPSTYTEHIQDPHRACCCCGSLKLTLGMAAKTKKSCLGVFGDFA